MSEESSMVICKKSFLSCRYEYFLSYQMQKQKTTKGTNIKGWDSRPNYNYKAAAQVPQHRRTAEGAVKVRQNPPKSTEQPKTSSLFAPKKTPMPHQKVGIYQKLHTPKKNRLVHSLKEHSDLLKVAISKVVDFLGK